MFVHHIAKDWRLAGLTAANFALCDYAEKLTLHPQKMTPDNLDALRKNGLSERAIHDATQIIGFFNYINRFADACGIEQENFIRSWEKSPEPITAIRQSDV